MEWKIGEIRQIDGEWYQCIKSNGSCAGCAGKFQPYSFCEGFEDCTGRIFKKLKKVGEPVTVKGRTFQKLTSDNNSCKECVFNVPNKACCKNSYIERICDDNGFWVEIKQNQEDMEEKKIQHYDCFFDRKLSELNLKPFDLEAAKAGKPVCTRGGRKARIICFDRVDAKPILALIASTDGKGEDVFDYFVSGKRMANALESDLDLMMLPEKKRGWANVYDDTPIYDTKEEALNRRSEFRGYIDTVKVSWEE